MCDEIPPPPNGMITYTQNPDFQFPNGTVAVLNCGEGFSPVNPGEPGGPVPSIELVCVEVEPGEGGEFVPRGGSTQGQELRCDRKSVNSISAADFIIVHTSHQQAVRCSLRLPMESSLTVLTLMLHSVWALWPPTPAMMGMNS